MARVVRVAPLFWRRLEAIGIHGGTQASAAVGATVAALAEAKELPGLVDTRASIPPTSAAFVRRVGGRNVWIWYRASEVELVLVTVTNTPPVPLDEE